MFLSNEQIGNLALTSITLLIHAAEPGEYLPSALNNDAKTKALLAKAEEASLFSPWPDQYGGKEKGVEKPFETMVEFVYVWLVDDEQRKKFPSNGSNEAPGQVELDDKVELFRAIETRMKELGFVYSHLEGPLEAKREVTKPNPVFKSLGLVVPARSNYYF